MVYTTTDVGGFIVDNPELMLDLVKRDHHAGYEFQLFVSCFNTDADLTMAEHMNNARYASRLMGAIERVAKAELDRLESTK